MESKGFLLKFSDLASGSEDLIKSAVDSIRTTLSSSCGEVETILGNLTPDLKYTIDRLLKGLTGGRLAKLGYSLCLCMVLRTHTINCERLYEYFETLDHSGISQYQIFIGTTLISLCLSKAGKASSKSLVAKLVDVYKTKASLAEVTGLALLSLPNAKATAKKLETQNDVNGLMINYATQSHETVLLQAPRHKELILRGTFKCLPRLHHIWKIIVSASISLSKEQTIWNNFVEKEIKIDDKMKTRRVLFSFLLFEEFLERKGDITSILTRDFMDCWQENVFSKKLRDHPKALALRDKFTSFLKTNSNNTQILQKLLEILTEVKNLDMIKAFTETVLEKSDIEVKKWYLQEISGFTKEKRGNFAVGEFWFVAKSTPKLFKPCVKKLIQLSQLPSTTGEHAKTKILNLACEPSQVQLIYSLFEAQTEISENVMKTVSRIKKYEIVPSEHKAGKRKAGDLCVITSAQLECLKELALLLGIEAILYNQIEDFAEFYKLLRGLYKSKVNNTDDLCMFLFSALARPVGYIRTGIKKAFKVFVNEISDEFLKKICDIIRTGEVSLEQTNEEIEETPVHGVDSLFEDNNTDVKKQEKIVKSNFLIRATDILEVIIKKSENIDQKMIVYETLVLSLRSASKAKGSQHLVGKFSSILQKIHRKPFIITAEHEKTLIELIILCVKGMHLDKNLNKVLTKNFTSLMNILEDLNSEECLKILLELLTKFFEKHNSNIKHECITEIVSKFKYNKKILVKLINYVKAGRSPIIQVQSAEVIKASLKHWKVDSEKFIHKLIDIAKGVEKQEIKLKIKNNIIKNILLSIHILKKSSTVVLENFHEEIEKLRLCVGDRPLFHGIFAQIKSATPKA